MAADSSPAWVSGQWYVALLGSRARITSHPCKQVYARPNVCGRSRPQGGPWSHHGSFPGLSNCRDRGASSLSCVSFRILIPPADQLLDSLRRLVIFPCFLHHPPHRIFCSQSPLWPVQRAVADTYRVPNSPSRGHAYPPLLLS